MGWISDTWATLKEAAGYRRYLVFSMVAGALALVAYLSGYPSMNWLASVPQWAVVLIIVETAILAWLMNYATALRKQAEPRVAVLGLRFWYDDTEGTQYVRVIIENTSTRDLVGLKAQIDTILDGSRPISSLDFPVQLWTQARLDETKARGAQFIRPFNLAANEPRPLRYFRLSEERIFKSTMVSKDTS